MRRVTNPRKLRRLGRFLNRGLTSPVWAISIPDFREWGGHWYVTELDGQNTLFWPRRNRIHREQEYINELDAARYTPPLSAEDEAAFKRAVAEFRASRPHPSMQRHRVRDWRVIPYLHV